MKQLLTLLSPILFLYTFFDFLFFLILKRNTDISYRIFRKSFIASSGRINDFLSKLITFFSRKFTDQELSLLESVEPKLLDEKQNFISSLKTNGYYVFKNKMSLNKLISLQDSLNKIPLEYFDFDTNESKAVKNIKNVKSNKLNRTKHSLVNNKEVLEWALSKELVFLAQEYLGTKPICDLLASWISLPTQDPKMISKAAQNYHFDMDRIKFIKFFVYLTDVSEKNGPHSYIKGSHRNLPYNLRRDGRFTDNEILDYYGRDNSIEIKGQMGSIIAVDTRGFHKGVPLISGKRDILQVEFSNSLYGHNYEKSKILLNSLNSTEKELLNNF